MRSICNHVRPDRQTLLFSATFKKRIEKLARDVLTDPVRIVQGDLGEANEDVTQHMLVFSNPQHKWNWLLAKLVQFLSEGSVLIFVTKKADAEQVANNLQLKEYDPVLLHGDMDQADRNRVIMRFKKREVDIMVATDVAARGLDIPHIKTVVNYDIARDIDTHTHRIGRTGRAGEKGTAYTLVTDKDKEFAGHLVRNLEGANQEVPKDLLNLAMQSSWFRKSRFKTGKAKAVNVGGAGLGYRERPSSSGGDSSAVPPNNHGTPRPSKGPATDRLSAMRETFRNQYNSQVRYDFICGLFRNSLIIFFSKVQSIVRSHMGKDTSAAGGLSNTISYTTVPGRLWWQEGEEKSLELSQLPFYYTFHIFFH